MSEPRPLIRKILTTLLLMAALVGGYFLYDWYDGRLQTQLADLHKQVQAIDVRRAQAERLNESLGFELANLKARHQEALQAKEGLAHDLEALKAADASELAAARQQIQAADAERDKVAAAYANLESLHATATQRIMALESDLAKVQGAIANAAAEYQAKVADLERHLNERISLSRTTPMDAELVRAAQAIGILPRDEVKGTDGDDSLSAQLAESKAQLEKLASDYAAVSDQLAKVQSALQDSQDQLAQQQAEHQEHVSGSAELTNRLEELAAQQQADQQTIAELKTQKEAATAETNACTEQAAAAESQIADLTARLASAEQMRTELQQQNDSAVAELQRTLAETRDKLAEVEQALKSDADPSAAVATPVADCSPGQGAETTSRVQALEASLEEERRNSAKALDELRSLFTAISALGGTYTERGFLLRLADSELRFPAGQGTLGPGQYPSLDRIAALLTQRPELSARIEGHTDSQGAAERNLALSRQRAVAVKQALIERGVASERLTAEGIGAARPLADNATAEGRGRNRRVEIYVTP